MLVLAKARIDQGKTQTDLAVEADTHQAIVSRIENGQFTPNDALLARLAAALDVSPAFILLQEVEKQQVAS